MVCMERLLSSQPGYYPRTDNTGNDSYLEKTDDLCCIRHTNISLPCSNKNSSSFFPHRAGVSFKNALSISATEQLTWHEKTRCTWCTGSSFSAQQWLSNCPHTPVTSSAY